MRTRNYCVMALLLCFCLVSPFAQDSDTLLLSYQRNFARSNLGTKLDLLRDAIDKDDMSLGPLFDQSIDFVLLNVELLRDEPVLTQLATEAARGIAATGHIASAHKLWRLFLAFRDSRTRVSVLQALSRTGGGDGQIIENVNQYLANQNTMYRAGLDSDFEVLAACIDALAIFNDGSSFPVLFSAMITEYPRHITQRAADALKGLSGDYKKYLVDVMRKNPLNEKLAAFRAGINNETFTQASRGELSEAALEISMQLEVVNEEEQRLLNELKYAAVRELGLQSWTRATSLVLEHFYSTQKAWLEGSVEKPRFLEAIETLGAMASTDAAHALSLQLGLVNAEMERNKQFDRDIMTSLIKALGSLGDKVAFDYLLYVGYLPYPDDVKAAARDALNRLKW